MHCFSASDIKTSSLNQGSGFARHKMASVPKLGIQPKNNTPLPILPNSYMLGSFQQIKRTCKLTRGALNRGILLAF